MLGGMSQNPAAVTEEMILKSQQHCLAASGLSQGAWPLESGRGNAQSVRVSCLLAHTCSHYDFSDDKFPGPNNSQSCLLSWPFLLIFITRGARCSHCGTIGDRDNQREEREEKELGVWYLGITPEFRRQRQEECCDLKDNLSYMGRCCGEREKHCPTPTDREGGRETETERQNRERWVGRGLKPDPVWHTPNPGFFQPVCSGRPTPPCNFV